MYEDYILKAEKDEVLKRLYELSPYYLFLEAAFIIYMLLGSDFGMFTIGLLLVCPTIGFLYICFIRLIKVKTAISHNELSIELEVIEDCNDSLWNVARGYYKLNLKSGYIVKTKNGNSYILDKSPFRKRVLKVSVNGKFFGLYLQEVK